MTGGECRYRERHQSCGQTQDKDTDLISHAYHLHRWTTRTSRAPDRKAAVNGGPPHSRRIVLRQASAVNVRPAAILGPATGVA